MLLLENIGHVFLGGGGLLNMRPLKLMGLTFGRTSLIRVVGVMLLLLQQS